MARRSRLDVRWDPVVVDRVRVAAEALGVRPSVIMRRAAELGMTQAIAEARSTLAAGAADTGNSGRDAFPRETVVASGPAGTVPVAGGASSRAPAVAADPRPAAAAPAHTVEPEGAMKLEVAVACCVAARDGRGSVAPADAPHARRAVLRGLVRVDGQECRNPAQVVQPGSSVSLLAAP